MRGEGNREGWRGLGFVAVLAAFDVGKDGHERHVAPVQVPHLLSMHSIRFQRFDLSG